MAKKLFSKDKILELRRLAEALLSAKEGISTAQFDGDPLKLIHELEVHQIELELQNDELARTQEKLAVSQSRYFDLYDLAPVGYITISEKGILLETNLTAATLLGKSRNEMIRQPISNFILSMDQDIYYRNRKRLFETEKPQKLELRMVQTDKLHFWAQLDMTAAQDEGGVPVCRITISDITSRKQIEAEKKKLESRMQQTQKMESIGTLAGGIAHDFNNLLYPIIGFSEMLIEDLPPDSPEHESAQEIFDAARRGGELMFSERINKEQAEANKVKGFLMKPVVKSEMAQMVRKVLDEASGSKGSG